MEPIAQRFSTLFRYNVHFTDDLFAAGNSLLEAVAAAPDNNGGPAKVLCVVDSGVAEAWPDLVVRIEEYCRGRTALQLVSPPLLVPGGERVKNTDEFVHLVQHAIRRHGICRHSFVLVVGGGAVLDMAGYAAATAHRGVRLIRVPTTVLAQNDSGVGVKNGINAYDLKNFLGVFAPPYAVVNDRQFLRTLSDRDWRSGIAEAVKVALVKDAAFFSFIEGAAPALAARDMAPMERLIYRCAELHLQHIRGGGDPFETGSSRPLDFGHWAAHKLEQMSHFRLRHGEAVAIGIAMDATYSWLAGLLEHRQWRRILHVLLTLGFTLDPPELVEADTSRGGPLLAGLTDFREHLGGRLTVTLLEEIGRGIETHEMNHDLVAASVWTVCQTAAFARALPLVQERRTNGSNVSHVHGPARGRVLHRKSRQGA